MPKWQELEKIRAASSIIRRRVQEGTTIKITDGPDGREERFVVVGPEDAFGGREVEMTAQAMVTVKDGKGVFFASRISLSSHDVMTVHGPAFLAVAEEAIARARELEDELRLLYPPE